MIECLSQVELGVQVKLKLLNVNVDNFRNSNHCSPQFPLMRLLKDPQSEPLCTACLSGVPGGLGLWENENTNFLSFVAHEDIGLVRVFAGVQDIGVQRLILIEIIFQNKLMLNGCIGEPFRECLNNSLLERVILG